MGVLSYAVGMIATGSGWKKRSAAVTVVCLLSIVCILANCIAISQSNIIWVMLAICVVFVMVANFVYHVLENGIEKMEV